MSGPLANHRILELTTTVSGPMAAMMLADQGAEVIKIEPPGVGDTARYLGPARGGVGAMFTMINRNKKSVALDLKDEAEKAIFVQLVETADVLIENYRPGVMERLGLGWDALSDVNPRLVYTSINGYGKDGPYAGRRVYDPLIQATAGGAAAQGGSAADDPPQLLRTIVFDKVTSLTAAQAVTAALLERTTTGRGQHLEVPMLTAALSYLWPDVMWSETLLGEGVTETGELADYFSVYRAQDGWVQIILLGDDALQLLSVWRGAELHLDPRFQALPSRLAHADEFQAAIEGLLADVTVDEVCEMLDAFGVPAARVNAPSAVHADPQVRHLDALVETEHPVAGAMRMPRPAVAFAGDAAGADFPARPSPTIGGDARAVLGALGLSEETIAALERRDAEHAARLKALMG